LKNSIQSVKLLHNTKNAQQPISAIVNHWREDKKTWYKKQYIIDKAVDENGYIMQKKLYKKLEHYHIIGEYHFICTKIKSRSSKVITPTFLVVWFNKDCFEFLSLHRNTYIT